VNQVTSQTEVGRQGGSEFIAKGAVMVTKSLGLARLPVRCLPVYSQTKTIKRGKTRHAVPHILRPPRHLDLNRDKAVVTPKVLVFILFGVKDQTALTAASETSEALQF
jgi:hypothetical protein